MADAVAAVAAAVAVVAVSVVPAVAQSTVAPSAVADGDAPLFAPVAVPGGVDEAVALASVSVQRPAGGGASAVVGFATAFTPPAGRWRVSVGVGDPAGEWVRTSMLWDGTAAAGEAVRLDGVLSTDLGAVDAAVAADGTVTIGLPDEVTGGSAGDVLWVEAVVGDDSDPASSTRSAWYSRGALFGDGAPGLVPGGIYGNVVGESALPIGLDATDPAVVEAGVPSVAELAGTRLSVEVGSPPATVAGDAVADVVDVITLADGTLPFDASPQVAVNLTAGSVELQLVQADGEVTEPSDGSWLEVGLTGPVDPSAVAPAIAIDIDAAYAALGLDPPGDGLAVSVSRLVRTADGTEVVATGVAARRAWFDQLAAAPLLPTTAPPVAAAPVEASGGPWVPIAVGVVVGVVAVAAAMALAQARARRRATRPVPAGPMWEPAPAVATAPPAPPVWEQSPVPVPADDPGGEPAWGSAAAVGDAGDAGGRQGAGEDAPPSPPGDGGPAAADPYDYGVAGRGADGGGGPPAASVAAPDAPAPADQALGAIDDDLAELARRLRRLDDDAP